MTTPKRRVKAVKAVKAWAGIVNDKIHIFALEDSYAEEHPGCSPAIYYARQSAMARYEKVIPVLIMPWPTHAMLVSPITRPKPKGKRK